MHLRGGIFIYERMLKQSKENADKIHDLQTILEQFPEGDLVCAKNGNRYKWYQTDGTNPTYLSKQKRALAEQLAAKKYFSAMLKDLLAEQKAIQAYLKRYKEPTSQSLLQHPGYGDLLKPHFQILSEELSAWADEPYESNSNYPEQLIHKCPSDLLVRSKSESLIAMSLYAHKIPFRYECALCLRDSAFREITVYPDFTIRHPRDGKRYYWEHFGMMDQPGVSEDKKL